MQLLSQRKLAFLALVFSMLFMLSRILTLAVRYSSASFILAVHKPALVARALTRKLTFPHKKVSAGILPADLHGLKLSSYLRSYTYVFTGKITCSAGPCAVEVQIVLNTDQNHNVRKVVKTAPDGSYSMEVPLNDYMHEQVDWKLTAWDEQSDPVEAHGRQILMEDHTITVENSLQLS